ncbi:MAG TPA: TIGR04283 family arsenosugar biosynthesis glycosyltransferase [Candidatus Limnocylindrales bacterium]|nr:TIGR04283 family arsenosugar biosynthesis glycosyltransferase [Candidatus Limnocylindrales bacterium]
MRLSVVMPALDEARQIGEAVASTVFGLEEEDELIVVDGGSGDDTVARARAAGAAVVSAPRGRGLQMNAGAACARGDVLLFQHADTRLPLGFRAAITAVLTEPAVTWGRFDLAFDRGGPVLRAIAHLITLRSRLFASATGDQAIFVRRSEFESIGGYREPRLFEDVELVQRLRRRGRMGIPGGRVVTSSRRWRNDGVWRTTLRMWTLKSLYLAGVPAQRLLDYYSDER